MLCKNQCTSSKFSQKYVVGMVPKKSLVRLPAKYIDHLVSIENLVRVHSNHIRNYKHHINKNS